MKQMMLALALISLLFASYTMAQEKSEGQCPATTATSIASDDETKAKGQCPIEAALAKLPTIAYKVGDESACCSNSAAALAKKTGKPIEYVVADKSFDNDQAAFTSLVEQTEKFVSEFTTPSKCEVSGATSIAGKSCSCPVQAEQTVALVKNAADSIAMTYLVGEKSCDCPVEAKEIATQSGEKTIYVVNGEKTECEMTARLNLARAKYKAAVESLVKAEKPTATID